ncbi:MAG: prepilin-type N-terminal cleavage/methylation domain-containing protein [Kiritimatiellae bacterium]|nr:prepilin-type N-terminal cleavage/methylation domain-containing protein [Kiritimatiellia bacterium]MCO6400769.1 prepilin-type N-terminal cleavage/methylation domain-containing protein [Verrucomicrobiota bacterium]
MRNNFHIQRRKGFTLIELLAAMAVLMILVLLLSRVFGVAANAWRSGNKRVESNNAGRAALEFMSRELSGLIASPQRPTMVLDADVDDALGMASDRLSFVTLDHQAEYRGTKYRDVQMVRYAIGPMPTNSSQTAAGRYALYRYVYEDYDNANFTCYTSDSWIDAFDNQQKNPALLGQVLADNIRSFEVFITPLGATEPDSKYNALDDGPAASIDIYIEILAEEDAIRAALLPEGTAKTEFLNSSVRRYATRIYVQNRAGYAIN